MWTLILVALLQGAPAQAAGGSDAVVPNAPMSARFSAVEGGPGTVTLGLTDVEPDDGENTIRIEAVVTGPLPGEGGGDIYALSAILTFPPEHLAFVAGSLRRGDLLARDGRDVLITGGVRTGGDGRLTVGSSRLGAVPGLPVPDGRSQVFTAVFRLLKPGAAGLAWEESTFIDSSIRPAGAARFIGGTLHIEGGTPPEPNREKN